MLVLCVFIHVREREREDTLVCLCVLIATAFAYKYTCISTLYQTIPKLLHTPLEAALSIIIPEEKHPLPVESIHYAIPNDQGQAVANVDTKIVDTNGYALQVGGKVVIND